MLFLNCVPPLIILILLDLMPLHDPTAGWHANLTFWMRSFVGAIITSTGILVQIQNLVLDVPLPTKKIVAIICGVSVGYTSTLMLVARFWVFPIPFMLTLGGLPFTVFLNGSMLLAIGTKDRVLLHKIAKFNNLVAIQTTMLIVYPCYNAMFLTLDRVGQVAFVALLPMIKITYKFILAKVASDLEDLAPAIVASVDLFDALYMTKCMQSAGTIGVGVVIIAFDLLQNCVAISSLFKQFAVLRHAHAQANAIVSTGRSTQALLAQIRNLFAKKQFVLATSLRIDSRSILRISCEAQAELDRLRSMQRGDDGDCGASRDAPTARSSRAVVPYPTGECKKTSSTPSEQFNDMLCITAPPPGDSTQARRNTRIIEATVHMLHQSESVVLVEYIETVVPIFYATYLLIIYHLPNAKYYQDMTQLTEQKLHQVVLNILIYACLELVSLVYVDQALTRNFSVSAFYQLAFTLEHEWRIFQSNFASWIMLIFQFLLIHNGALQRHLLWHRRLSHPSHF